MVRFGHHAGHPVFALLLLVLLAALVVIGVIALVRSWRGPHGGAAPFRPGTPGTVVDPAFTELRVRYARGDVTWDEFSQRAANLGHPVYPGAGPGTTSPGAPPPHPPS
jgi:uncharacterized membrane protein